MLSSIYHHRRFGTIARAALAGASLFALSLPLRAETTPTPPAPTAAPAPPSATPDAQKPDAQRADADAMAARRAADRAAFLDARIAAVHAGLQLTPDQDALWPPVDKAAHDLAGAMRAGRDRRRDEAAPANGIEGLQRFSDRAFARGNALKRFSDAVTPLYASLTADQKDRLPMLMHGLGPHRGRQFGMRGQERPGMDRDRRGEGEGGPSFRDEGRRGGERMGDARGGRYRDERADDGARRDWGFLDRGRRQRDDRGGYGRESDDAD